MSAPASFLRQLVVPLRLPKPINPALLKHTEERAEDAQNRVADAITTLAGSMTFVYIHIVWFGVLDRLRRREVSVRPAHDDRLTGGDLPRLCDRLGP
jgi:hypothetical protein